MTKDSDQQKNRAAFNALDVDFLKESGLVNQLDKEQKDLYQDRLSRNLLDGDLLSNLLDIINTQITASTKAILATASSSSMSTLLPDYKASTGVVAEVDTIGVDLSRDDGSNRQGIHVDRTRSLTIYQIQGSVEVKNRVNSGGTTTITLKQN